MVFKVLIVCNFAIQLCFLPKWENSCCPSWKVEQKNTFKKYDKEKNTSLEYNDLYTRVRLISSINKRNRHKHQIIFKRAISSMTVPSVWCLNCNGSSKNILSITVTFLKCSIYFSLKTCSIVQNKRGIIILGEGRKWSDNFN